MKQCRICNRDILIGNARVLCGRKSCATKNKKIWQQTQKKKEQAEVIAEGKVCKRCKTKVHELGMKSYCSECSELMKSRHFSSYIPKDGIPKPTKEPRKCRTKKCDIPLTGKQQYCSKCSQKRINKRAKDIEARKRKNKGMKVRSVAQSLKPINPIFLVRGNISNSGNGITMYEQ